MSVQSSPLRDGGYRNYRRESTQSRVNLGGAALAYSRKSIPVFPCKPGDKTPAYERRTLEHGHRDATTDEAQIRRWWSKWPDANLAIPTGKRSGVISLDIDTYKKGAWSLEDVERELGELPETVVVETGGGGRQLLYAYPEDADDLRNGIPEDELGPGICVKSDGGYILCPPSRTTGAYKVLERRPLAPAPEWLVKALRKQPPPAQGNVTALPRTRVDVELDGPVIPANTRNWTLFRIGCRLRARGLDRDEVLEHLRPINATRCVSPLDSGELEKIATSAARYEPGNASPEVSPEVLRAIDAIEAHVMGHEWPGVGGKSERDAMIALIRLARMHGTMIPAGVRVPVGVRTLALMASVSKSSLLDNVRGGEKRPGTITRLKIAGEIRSDNGARHDKDAGAFVLLTPRASVDHSTTRRLSLEPRVACGPPLRAPLTAPRLRWSRPVFDGTERVGTISRLGKSKGEIIDHLEAAGGTLTFEDLAEALAGENGKRPRARDLRRRHLDPLEAAAVVECSRDAVSLTANWRDALDERREQDREIADHRRDAEEYKRQGDAYRNRHKQPPDRHPANARVPGDGFVGELEKLPPVLPARDLVGLIRTRVETPSGAGVLWDVKGEEARVVLDSDLSRWVPLHIAELVVEGRAA